MNGLAHPSRVFSRANRFMASARRRWSALDRVATPGGGLVALTLLFIAISYWWVSNDDRVPDSATGNHVRIAFSYYDSLRGGDVLAPLGDFNIYPPLTHIVGMFGVMIGGVGLSAPIMAGNVVFVPLLALGCYGAGTVAYGRWVGLLAALFALGTPMVIAHFHAFMLDVPLTAMVAVTVWLLLASDRFSRPGLSAVAGVAFGLGLMTKSTFPLYVAGLIALLLVTGGWRSWRGVAAFCVAAAVVSAPWYVQNLTEITSLTGGAISDQTLVTANPPRWSARGFLWYGANAVEFQLYLPLAVFVLVGVVVAVRRWLWERGRSGYTPELIVGGVSAYLAVSLLSVKDPRYSLPCLVFAAVLGTAWMVKRNGVPHPLPVAALLSVVVLNALSIAFGLGGSHRIDLPGDWQNDGFLGGKATILAPPAVAEVGPGEPGEDGVRQLLAAAKADGVRQLYLLEAGMDDWRSFNPNGLAVLARGEDLGTPPGNDPKRLSARDRIVIRRAPVAGDPPPCLRLRDGKGVYLAKGGPNPYIVPFETLEVLCPTTLSSARAF